HVLSTARRFPYTTLFRSRRDVAGALRDVAARTNPGAQCGPQFLAYLLVDLAPLRSLQEVHLAVHGEVLHVETPDLFAVGATTALATVDGLEVNGPGLGAVEPVADEMAVVVAAQAPRPDAWDVADDDGRGGHDGSPSSGRR